MAPECVWPYCVLNEFVQLESKNVTMTAASGLMQNIAKARKLLYLFQPDVAAREDVRRWT